MGRGRTALLIRCLPDEAARIRRDSRADHRTIAGYLLHLLERSVYIQERFNRVPESWAEAETRLSRAKTRRTTILLRCSLREAARIRSAAASRKMSISAFVTFSVHRHWKVLDQIALPHGG